jgi:rhodanese-related sulfurtransferase
LFSTAIDDLLNVMAEFGKWGALLAIIALALFIGHKWWQRHLFLRELRMARISVDELYQLRQQSNAPIIIDVRSAVSQQGGRIPGAISIAGEDMEAFELDTSPDTEVILYCSCPNEASAAKVAKQLMQKGYKRVRPLAGGIEAWIAAGHIIEI